MQWRLLLLTSASYLFYSCWQFDNVSDLTQSLAVDSWAAFFRSIHRWRFTWLMLGSSSVDYFAARAIHGAPAEARLRRKLLLALSLSANLGLLAYFKYAGFFSEIISAISSAIGAGSLPILSLVLPVGISFYTFESMSYVIDVYRGLAQPAKSYLDYACFISFFPHLVAGPIIRYSDILHQFRDAAWTRAKPDWQQVNLGLVLLTCGLSKKLLIADRLAEQINPLWQALGDGQTLGVAGSWAAVLGYTFRIYFDFSGYSDMAIGLGHLFAVRLPQNFDSPYQATDPVDFWRRWHMTLSSWLRDYLYIPLGGNRGGRQSRNLMYTMLLGGLWHGAASLFVLWGAWHGLLLAAFHVGTRRGWLAAPTGRWQLWMRRQLTFALVVVGWVFFRAADVHSRSFDALSVQPAAAMLGQMVGLGGWACDLAIPKGGVRLAALVAFCWLWCNFLPNSNAVAYHMRFSLGRAAIAGATFGLCALECGRAVDFLYFRF